MSCTEAKVVWAAGSPRRQRSRRYRGRYGWNAVSVWNIRFDRDDVEVWRSASVRVGTMFCTMPAAVFGQIADRLAELPGDGQHA